MNGPTAAGADGARRFPPGFLWGAGTSSYQIEGAVQERGASIWDAFTHSPGAINGGDTGDIACDSYHRMAQDVALIAALGLGAYRFSIAWPRVLPSGHGAVHQRGLDYYRALVHELRRHEIVPVATVYHWELPQALEDEGGWTRRETAERLAHYAGVLAAALGDQVGMWITVNEPTQVVHQGYRLGTHAPGRRDPAAAALATHNILLGHGLALQALRATLPAGTPVGIALDPHPYRALDTAAHAAVAQLDAEHNRIYLDPVLHGAYPTGAVRGQLLPPDQAIRDGDLELINGRLDFLGVNYYRPHYVRTGDWRDLRLGETPLPDQPGFVEYLPPGMERTTMDWLVDPDGLRALLERLHTESGGLPLYITENGCAADDYLTPEGVVNDVARIDYIQGHLSAALTAIEHGVTLAGYCHWSLLDNFEWAWGYRRRFGLYYVDFASQRRVLKRSGAFYAEIVHSGALPGVAGAVTSDPARLSAAVAGARV